MDLFYRKFGEGKPLIILHGLFGMSDNWLTLGKRFAENFVVFLVDQRNHGQSPHSDEFTYSAMSDDLKEFIQDHQLEKPFVLGHSMGGKTAMQFAIDHPQLLEKLIVADIGPWQYPVLHQPIIDGLYSLDLGRVSSRKEADEQLADKIPEFGIRQFLLKNLYWKEKDQLGWRMNLDVISDQIQNVCEALEIKEPVKIPTLFIRGGRSDYIKEEDYDRLKTSFPNGRLETLNAGHWVHAEKPEEFYQLVYSFLTE